MFVIPLFLFQNFRVMLDMPSQYMHHCFVLLCEVCCVSLLGLGIIVVFFVTYGSRLAIHDRSLCISCTSQVFVSLLLESQKGIAPLFQLENFRCLFSIIRLQPSIKKGIGSSNKRFVCFSNKNNICKQLCLSGSRGPFSKHLG